jgi:gamma-glutamylputrescine oxidase
VYYDASIEKADLEIESGAMPQRRCSIQYCSVQKIYLYQMQLSVWEKESFFEPQDIIIVGSGLVALWSALELKQQQPNLKITILERSLIPSGASTRNAGFACFGSPSELMYDKEVLGEDKMWEIVEMRYKGMQKMARVLREEAIGMVICGGYEVYNTPTSVADDSIGWLNKGLKEITGNDQCFSWANDRLRTFRFSGFDAMIENKLEGYLHSGKLVQTLLRKVQALGVQVFGSFEVKHWEKVNGKMIINPGEEISLTAQQLLICTNAFTSTLLPELNIIPARGQIILTTPIEGLSMKGAFHYDEGFYYFRNLGNRVLLGGARNKAFDAERTTEMITSEIIQHQLEQFLSHHILPGQSFTIEQRWSGIMGFTDNKEPITKRLDDNISVAISCNGMGVALAPIIAEKVCEMMS